MNALRRPPLWPLTLLVMFPQLVGTIYSPVLLGIVISFHVNSERAAQTLSVYFVVLAVDVAMWGWLSDYTGRRWAMLAGLICYRIGCAAVVAANDFSALLLARMISAIGAAAESVVIQTMLRDCCESTALSCVFSVMGAALTLSPVFGLLNGGWLVNLYGHTGASAAFVLLALLLLILIAAMLSETRPEHTLSPKLAGLFSRIIRDNELRKNALLVALLNITLFSYYSLTPFLFGRLGWNSKVPGWTGLLLTFASLSGSLLNRRLLTTGLMLKRLVCYVCVLAALSGLVAWCLQRSARILIPVFGAVIAYGTAVPNVLSQALHHYHEQAGAAGVLFGSSYYLLLGMMLGLAGVVQQLGLVLNVCALLAWLYSLSHR